MPDSTTASAPLSGAPSASSAGVVGGRNSTLTLSGIVGPSASTQSVVISEFDLNRFQDLGPASLTSLLSGDSEYSFDLTGLSSDHELYAKVTDTNGNVTYFPTDVSVQTNITGELFTSIVNYYDIGTDSLTGSSFIKANGRQLYTSAVGELPDGSTSYTYQGGYFFDRSKTLYRFTDVYDSSGELGQHVTFYKDNTRVTDVLGPGQLVRAFGSDTFNEHSSATSFIIGEGVGAETFNDFRVGGLHHDTISLPQADSARLGSILAHAKSDDHGTTLNLGHGDTLTFTGTSALALQRHPDDFTFHDRAYLNSFPVFG